MADTFSTLETNILKAKGAADADLQAMLAAGIVCRADFQTVGDADTLLALIPGLKPEAARSILQWAGVMSAPARSDGPVLVDSADVVYCVHCRTKQPKDYKSGDLCFACGKQAESVLSCYWCASSGPGRFCRACGAEFVPTGELELAILLRREGLPKDEIPKRLSSMTTADKDDLWGRVRRARGV